MLNACVNIYMWILYTQQHICMHWCCICVRWKCSSDPKYIDFENKLTLKPSNTRTHREQYEYKVYISNESSNKYVNWCSLSSTCNMGMLVWLMVDSISLPGGTTHRFNIYVYRRWFSWHKSFDALKWNSRQHSMNAIKML